MFDQSSPATDQAKDVVIMVQDTRLVCTKTPVGSWICCAEDEAPSCARGFTPSSAAANWERAREIGE